MLKLNQKLSRFCAAFSLVEILVALVIVSLITAALAPVITKKLSSSAITIVGGGGNNGIIETSTAPQSQKDCNTVGAQLVYVETNAEQKTGLCVTQYNIGDGNFSIPTGSIDENIEAGTSKSDGYCNTKKCCWHGATSGTNCDNTNGSYSGCNRTVCNWEAANSICDNLSYGGYSNWRLPTKDELEKMNPDTYSKIGSEHSGDGGLMFCDSEAGYNSARCSAAEACLGSYDGYCGAYSMWSGVQDGLTNAFSRYLYGGSWNNYSDSYPHAISTRCVLGAITVKTVSDTACSNGSFLNEDSACTSCTIHSPKCTSCTKDFCSACADGWKVSATGGCEDPNKKSCTITFGEAGDKQFTIPSDVDSMEVTLVSGGNGGNGGNGIVITHTFSTKTAVSSPTETNLETVLGTGIIDWTIPEVVKNKNVLINACGGGGGGGGMSKGTNGSANGSNGGRGGYVLNQVLKTPNKTSLKINIGGGGGHGARDDTNNCGAGGYSYAGGGGVSAGGTGCRPLNFSSETYGQGGVTVGNWGTGSPGKAGYDYGYSFSDLGITTYGKGGSDGGNGYRGGAGGDGGVVGGGGGGGAPAGCGAGGGSATLFLEDDLIVNPNYVASGGGGGAGGGYTSSDNGKSSGGGGGGGGGINASDGGHGGYAKSNNYLTDGSNGKDIGSTLPSFDTTNFCAGGIKGNPATDGKPGIMIIKYIGVGTTTTGGLGGGTGAIVPLQTVDLTTNDYIAAGEVLKIHVGKGGIGGAGAHIKDDGTIITSGSAGTQGEETYISNNSNVKILATKGMQTGENAGYITNGKNSTQIVVDGFLNSNGSNNTGKFGGNGGTIILETRELVGGLGATTEADGASALIGNYGTGGGGGYGTMAGGNGADGYAKIKFMTSSANCTAAKAEIAYNDFLQNKNNLFMKIKLAITNIKDFIIALFKPQVKCKTCMK